MYTYVTHMLLGEHSPPLFREYKPESPCLGYKSGFLRSPPKDYETKYIEELDRKEDRK